MIVIKKKVIGAALAALLIVTISGCACSHDFKAVMCSEPLKCIKCGALSEEIAGHEEGAYLYCPRCDTIIDQRKLVSAYSYACDGMKTLKNFAVTQDTYACIELFDLLCGTKATEDFEKKGAIIIRHTYSSNTDDITEMWRLWMKQRIVTE